MATLPGRRFPGSMVVPPVFVTLSGCPAISSWIVLAYPLAPPSGNRLRLVIFQDGKIIGQP
jgi:hypothetical protein